MQTDMTVGKPMKMLLNFTIPVFLGNAVSFTHLDVYKRQSVNRMCCGGLFLGDAALSAQQRDDTCLLYTSRCV